MHDLGSARKWVTESVMTNFSDWSSDSFCSILPGLPNDVAKFCLALVPRKYLPVMGSVCKRWRSFIQSKEFITIRKETGMIEEWLYFLTSDSQGMGSHWEMMSSLEGKSRMLPQMPGPVKTGFSVVVLGGKLLIIGGLSMDDCVQKNASADVYQYDSCLNRWSKLAKMHIARYDFACTEVGGLIYAVGGYGCDGESLSSAEVYDPDTNKWTLIESLRRPRYGCFACSFGGKLYVMGGRSSFIIGNSRFVDVYCPEERAWCEIKNRGCVMVTAHAVLGMQLFCMEWKDQRILSVFDPTDNSWRKVPVPLTGSSAIGFRFGILGGKLLLFSMEEDPGYRTLLYDPSAPAGSEWRTSSLKPSGLCLCTVTIKA
ncbi:F-box/kelch-repeat protein [Apostasia shenzhenica]|uniref:F-box/kelch-repeat protein n=1 Tax=Apostasia shenzhenica TaxID=1088818 RepID=A0A2I0AQA9_9ASPA|nr:F-box/kelch-repeat protein [Apostasia shenzhenica]